MARCLTISPEVLSQRLQPSHLRSCEVNYVIDLLVGRAGIEPATT